MIKSGKDKQHRNQPSKNYFILFVNVNLAYIWRIAS